MPFIVERYVDYSETKTKEEEVVDLLELVSTREGESKGGGGRAAAYMSNHAQRNNSSN